jgi:hypothetical protein
MEDTKLALIGFAIFGPLAIAGLIIICVTTVIPKQLGG